MSRFEFNGVVRITKIGATYLIATVVLAIAALNTGNNAIYIAVAFMLGCLLLSGIASKSGLKHLTIEIDEIDEAWAGRPADGRVRVTNRSRIWNVRDVVLTSENLAKPVLIPLLRSRSTVEAPASFVFRRRGHAHLGAIDSYTRYPFGFFLKKRRLRVASDVIVFPALLAEQDVAERFRTVAGEERSVNRPGIGSDIHSFREYVHGDSLRHVHWRKSASLGRWVMKQTELEARHVVHVVVDPYRPRTATDAEFELMISAAATFIRDALQRGMDVSLVLPRVTLRAHESHASRPLFRALALIEPQFEPMIQTLDRDSVVFSLPEGQLDAKSA